MISGAIYRVIRDNGSLCGTVQTDGCKCWVMPDDGAPADLLALRGQAYNTPQAVLDAVNAIAGCSAGPFCTTV